MKTPRKFLAPITSRRPSARAQVNSAGNDTVPKALENNIAHVPEPPPSSTVTARPPGDGDDSVGQGSDRRERRKRRNARVAGHSVHQSGQPSSSRNLSVREVAMLDEEIKILRTQLNQKLHLQNIQLKKMLERFEDS
ncbi:hypothetical protein [Sinorhizobium meliloti]|uniref:hypothetical protein n=1 Tax=Rhizobium meliloti TaxID=382 RepID=UPI0005187698|nr:hypothetical protein [Sinorhizobium meliloti]